MWKMSKTLAACVFAAAWWGIFYPELCFSEETCALVRTENAQDESRGTQKRTEDVQDESRGTQKQTEDVQGESRGTQKQTEDVQGESRGAKKQTERGQNRREGNQGGFEEIDAAAVWRASGDEIRIRSRLWEWCEENLFDG